MSITGSLFRMVAPALVDNLEAQGLFKGTTRATPSLVPEMFIGREGIKDPKVTGKLSKDKKYDSLLRNHLEGKVAGFYVHGDDGADDYSNRELPPSYDVMDDGFQNNPKNVVMSFINQLKYSGVYVPDELVQAFNDYNDGKFGQLED